MDDPVNINLFIRFIGKIIMRVNDFEEIAFLIVKVDFLLIFNTKITMLKRSYQWDHEPDTDTLTPW